MRRAGGRIFAGMAHRTGPVRRGPPDSGRAEGQSLTEPITPSFHKIASFCALAAAERALGVAAKSALAHRSKSRLDYLAHLRRRRPLGELSKYQGVTVRGHRVSRSQGHQPGDASAIAGAENRMSRWIATKSAPVCECSMPPDALPRCRLKPSRSQQNGVSLIFVATENYFNGDVKVMERRPRPIPKRINWWSPASSIWELRSRRRTWIALSNAC